MASFTFAGIEKVAAVLNVSPRWRAIAELITVEAKANCPVSAGKGPHLRDNLHYVIVPGPTGPRLFVGSTLPQSAYLIQGTKPHIIKSHGPWSLHNAVSDQWFGPLVDHPGTKPNSFIMDAARRVIRSTAAL